MLGIIELEVFKFIFVVSKIGFKGIEELEMVFEYFNMGYIYNII